MQNEWDRLAKQSLALWQDGAKDEAAAMFALTVRRYHHDFCKTKQFIDLILGPIGTYMLTHHNWEKLLDELSLNPAVLEQTCAGSKK